MKLSLNNSKITILTLVGLFIIMILSSCSNSQNAKASKVEKSSSSVSEKPKVDLHTATFMNNIAAVKQNIDAGVDINKKDQYGSTPLIVASLFGKTEIASLLIDADADLNIKGKDGSTALHTASFYCRTEIVKALLAKGADKSIKNSYNSTALEAMSVPFKDVKAIYQAVAKQLGPFGLKLDFKLIEKTRPHVAEILMK